MIVDQLDNWPRYSWPNLAFAQAFEALAALRPDVPAGKTALSGDDVFFMVQDYETKPAAEFFEAHRLYADIQILLEGRERILWTPAPEGLTVTTPYEPDAEFYAPTPEAASLVLEPGRFAVFFPWDGHAPGLAASDPAPVRKAVAKVRVA
jgi:YhcH/YjgK/YiaL family protein